MRFSIIYCLIILTTNISFAQFPENTKIIENIIEEIATSSEEAIDYTSLFDDLMFFLENPLNINTATRADLETIQFLNDFQIENILHYQRYSGEMQTIYELQLVEGLSSEAIQMLLPFVMVAKAEKQQIPDFKKAIKFGKHTVFLRTIFLIQEQKGFSDIDEAELELNKNKRYLGNKYKYYTRYQFDYKKKIQFGFVAEKDAGEEFFAGAQKYGFDYYSGHIVIKDFWKFKNIFIGDYHVKFGQSLAICSDLVLGKSSYPLNIRRKFNGIKKYSSTDENKFMRGFAGTAVFGNFDITGFISYKNIDGNIEKLDTLTNNSDIFTSFVRTGMHRTINELEDRKNISEFIYGGNLQWNKKRFKIGASFIQYHFGTDLKKEIKPYQKFDFQGSKNANASIDYQANYHNFYFFGETAVSLNGGFAILNGTLISLAALHRHYTRDYRAYYSTGFAEKAGTSNEKGLYIGTEIHPFRKFTITAYYDIYKFLWLRFNADAPSDGFDFFSSISYNINRYIKAGIRYKHENKQVNGADDYTSIRPLVISKKQEFRFNISYRVSKTILLKNRLGISQYKKEDRSTETGFLLYQDINYSPQSFPMVVNFRFGLFDTDYNARIYSYENDILYGYSIPAYVGKGFRTYFNIRYTVVENFIDIWIRYSQFGYVDKENIGTQLTEINGNNKSEVKLQMRIKLNRRKKYKINK